MARPYGSRTLIGICTALVVLLGALAVVQYRWSARVAAADAQREREHLDSAASLFARRFDAIATQAVSFLQNHAWAAVQANRPLTPKPKLLADLYFVDLSAEGKPKTRRLAPDGLFTPAPLPDWAALPRCAAVAIEQPPAVVAPVYDLAVNERGGANGVRIFQAIRQHGGRCFVAALDQAYLRDTLLPQLIAEAFGATASREYEFAVAPVYGAVARPDLTRPFFSIAPAELAMGKPPLKPPPGQSAMIVQRFESAVISTGPTRLASLFGPGIWELQVAHKGLPLAAAFQQERYRELLLSLAVEVLLLAAVVFLVIAARRMQRLADQKMQFVAGVSHELRTPVSAISMLSRNQADGLVAGADRVRQYGELIHQQSRRLNEMVEQTLQYAGIHSGLRRPARNPVDLRRLIEDAVEARREELSRSGFAVEVALGDGLPAIQGDAQWLRAAVDNLLSNAERHAGAGHWICVSAVHDAPDKEVRIAVEDHGSGIDPADQADIFEPFSRGRAAVEAQIPGAGLGLSLVRSAAEAHRGTVTLVSQPGRGSIFTLHLPL